MAGEIASAYVSILPSFRSGGSTLSRQLSGQGAAAGDAAGNASAEHFSSSFSSRAKSFAGTVAKGLAFAFGGIAIAGATIGLKTAAGMEQARISFTTMLGSAQKADVFLKQLAAFAAKTPFEFPELQTAASSLISAGFAASDVIPIMTTLGDVTSGMGTGAEGVQRATVALQQMSAAGKITGEDLNQLRDAGVPVFDLLAAATGKSKEEVAGLAAAGKLGKTEMTQLFDALKSGHGLERFSGLMDKQSQSLVGVISTLKDTIGQGLAKAFEPLIPIIENLIPKIATFAGVILGGLGKAFASVIKFVSGLGSSFGPVKGFLASSQGLFGIWGKALSDAFKTLGKLAGNILGGIRTFLVNNATTWRDWAYSIEGLVTKLGILVGAIAARIQQVWAKHGDQIMAVATRVWEVVKAVIGSGLAIISGLLSGVTAIIDGDWTTAWESLQGIVKNTLNSLTSIFGPFTFAVVGLVAGLVAFKATMLGVNAVIRVTKALTLAWAKVQAAFNIIMDANPIVLVAAAVIGLGIALFLAYKRFAGFRRIVDAVFAAVKGFFVDNADTFREWGDKVKAILSGAAKIFETVFGAIRAVVLAVGDWLVSFWADHGGQIVTTATVFLTALWNVVKVQFELIKSVISAALQVVSGIIDTVLAVIHGDWSGAWNGIKQIVGGVWDAVVAIVKAALGMLGAIIPAALAALGLAWSLAWDGIKTATAAVFDEIVTWVAGLPGRLVSALGDLLSTLYQKGKDLLQGLWNGATAKLIEFNLWVAALPGRIIGWLGDTAHMLWDAGVKIVQGLIDGMQSKLADLGHMAWTVAQMVAFHFPGSPVKKGPLKVLNRGYAGGQIAKMLADGMAAEAAAVARAATVLAGSARVDAVPMGVTAPRGLSRLPSGLDRAAPVTAAGHSIVVNQYGVEKSDVDMLYSARDALSVLVH